MTCPTIRNIYWPSRSGQRGAPVSSSAQERDATDPSRLWAFRVGGAPVEARQLRGSERTMTRRRGGRPKDPAMRRCPAFSQGTRRRGAAGSCKPIKPSRAERRRFLRARLLFAVCCSTSSRCHVPGKHMMPRGHPRGAAGAVKRPVFRTPLRGVEEDIRASRPARPGAGQNMGR